MLGIKRKDSASAALHQAETAIESAKLDLKKATATALQALDNADRSRRAVNGVARGFEAAAATAQQASAVRVAADLHLQALQQKAAQLRGEIDREQRGWTAPPAPAPVVWPDERLPLDERLDALDLLVGRLERRCRRADEAARQTAAKLDGLRPYDSRLQPGVQAARFSDASAAAAAALSERTYANNALVRCRRELHELNLRVA